MDTRTKGRAIHGRQNRGSLTVEACLVFPFFLMFFLTLVFVARVACAHIAMEHAVSQSAKQLSGYSYVLEQLNQLEDEFAVEGRNVSLLDCAQELKLTESGETDLGSLGPLMDEFDIGQKSSGLQIGQVLLDVSKELTDAGGEGYYSLKAKFKYAIAKCLLERYCSKNGIDSSDYRLVLVELPQSNTEFEYKTGQESNKALYGQLGYTPCREDVIIAVEYKVKLPFGFLGLDSLTSRHIAVEKAWVRGGNGSYSEDGGDEEKNPSDKNKNLVVYVTKSGQCYHEEYCCHLYGGKQPIRLSEAQAKGYRPCKRCITKDASNWHY